MRRILYVIILALAPSIAAAAGKPKQTEKNERASYTADISAPHTETRHRPFVMELRAEYASGRFAFTGPKLGEHEPIKFEAAHNEIDPGLARLIARNCTEAGKHCSVIVAFNFAGCDKQRRADERIKDRAAACQITQVKPVVSLR